MALPECGARKRNGDPCTKPAGFGTDHVGFGRCKFHGGGSKAKHGRYSSNPAVRIPALVMAAAETALPDAAPELLEFLTSRLVAMHDAAIDFIPEADRAKASKRMLDRVSRVREAVA